MNTIISRVPKHWHSFVDLVYPRTCPICEKALLREEKHICISCQLQLPVIDNNSAENKEMESRFWGKIKIEKAYGYLRYDKYGATKKILHEIKYKSNADLAFQMGVLMGEEMKNYDFSHAGFIIPVPLHPKKEKIRGFNQSLELARGFSKGINIPVREDLVKRVINTKTQTKLDRMERWENVEAIFEYDKCKSPQESTVIIFDDVVTTGATIESLAKSLMSSGIENIIVVAFSIAI